MEANVLPNSLSSNPIGIPNIYLGKHPSEGEMSMSEHPHPWQQSTMLSHLLWSLLSQPLPSWLWIKQVDIFGYSFWIFLDNFWCSFFPFLSFESETPSSALHCFPFSLSHSLPKYILLFWKSYSLVFWITLFIWCNCMADHPSQRYPGSLVSSSYQKGKE